MPGLAAISIEGPKAVGKTATALTRATVYRLDDVGQRQIIEADPSRLTQGQPPIVVDEWQKWPPSWDVVRRAVDTRPSPGRFLLTCSASPGGVETHSGAGRIVPIRMRPLSLAERGFTASVSLGELLAGSRPDISGTTSVTLDDYVAQILASGFPGMRGLTEADVRHLRTHRGEREIDFIVIGPDAGIVAVEVKLAATVDADDTKHLRWLKARIGDRLMDAVIVTTGTDAYRREDGIAVVPAALLGP